MRKLIFVVVFLLFKSAFGQNVSKDYEVYSKTADKLFKNKEYSEAVKFYTKAFNSNNGLATVAHRYHAASCWAQINQPDSAFFQLEKIVNRGKFKDLDLIASDYNLKPLRQDPRWRSIIEKVTNNRNL